MSIDTTTAEQQLALALDTKEREEKTLVEDITLSRTEIRKLLLMSDRTNLPSWTSDHRQYRFLRLPNRLKVLLIENNKTSMAQARLSVAAGSYDEPEAFPGLAHFLEHMLFQGCEKYPNDNEYQDYITSRCGSYDAFTEDENTQFSFSIEHQYFEEALDRLSGFFINPFLNKEYAEREVNVVHMEFTGNLESDDFRGSHVNKCFVNPEHPEHRFNWGNLDTLQNIETVLPALRAFHQKHYTADNMTLVLHSHHPLKTLEYFAAKYFSPIVRSTQQISKPLRKPAYLTEALGIIVHIESIEKNNLFVLSFFLDKKRTIELEQAMIYILFLLNSFSEGGLFDILKSKGWVRDRTLEGASFSAQVEYIADCQVELALMYPLTEVGKTKIDEISIATLDYLQFIKRQGIDKRFFDEIRKTNLRIFKFKADTLNSIEKFISNLEDYPLKNFFVGADILEDTAFPRALIRKILENLTFKNSQQFVLLDPNSAENSEEDDDNTSDPAEGSKNNHENKPALFWQDASVEPYTRTKYKMRPISEQLKAWKETQNTVFKLPPESLFLPTDFKIKALSQKFQYPSLIWNKERLRIFLSQDLYFKKPFVMTDFIFVSGLTRDTIENAALQMIYYQLFAFMVKKKLGRSLGLAEVVPVFSVVSRGLRITISGYSDKHEKAVLELIEVMATSTVDPDNFSEIKKTYIDSLLSLKTKSSEGQLGFYLDVLLNRFEYSDQQLLSVLEQIDIKLFQEYIEKFRKSVRLEMYSHGNRTPKQTIKLGEDILTKFILTPGIVFEPQSLIAHLQPGYSGHYLMQTDLTRNAVVLFLQAPDPSLRTSLLLLSLSKIIDPKFFHQLRTTEQLAYSIGCDQHGNEMHFGLAFRIESTEYSSAYLLERIEDFIVNFEKKLSEVTEEEFVSCRDAMIRACNESINNPASPSTYFSLFSEAFKTGTYRFRKVLETLELYKTLTLPMLQALYKELIGDKTKRKLVFRTDDKNILKAITNAVENTVLSQPQDGQIDQSGVVTIEITENSTPQDAQVSPNTVVDLVMSYYSDYKPQKDTLEEQINLFKSITPHFTDYMLKGERYIRSLLEFNRGFTQGNMEAGDMVIVGADDVATVLQQTPLARQEQAAVGENGAVDALAHTLLAKQEQPINTVLTYCFGQYQAASQKDVSSTQGVDQKAAIKVYKKS